MQDASFEKLDEKRGDMAFFPLLQAGEGTPVEVELAIRTAGDAASSAALVREAVSKVDPRLEFSNVKTLRAQVESSFDQQRLTARLVSFFGLLALLLACVGLYGVVAQGVARRTNEFGIRMALGAQQGDILRSVFRETTVLLLEGLLIGVPVAIGAGRLIAAQLFGLRPMDAFSFMLAIVTLGVVSAVAGLIPAFRASRVDPMVALRYE